jgi:hypothetical protein
MGETDTTELTVMLSQNQATCLKRAVEKKKKPADLSTSGPLL